MSITYKWRKPLAVFRGGLRKMAGSALALAAEGVAMTRLIFDTLSLLFFGLLLGAWLHARFGKPTVEGGWWDVALGLAMVM